MPIFPLLFLLVLFTSCENSTSKRMPVPEGGPVQVASHSFLKEGVYKVDYYARKEATAGEKKVLEKVSKLMETNSRTQRFFSEIDEGKKPSYSPGIGISKAEYDQLTEFFANTRPGKFSGTLSIKKEGDRLVFNGDGRLSILDSVTINIMSVSATFGQHTMRRLTDSVDLSDVYIPGNDTLQTFELYNGPDGIMGLTALGGVYELLVGKLVPGDKRYLSFFYKAPAGSDQPFPEQVIVIID